MEDIIEHTDASKYAYEARIYSVDGKYEKVFTDKEFIEKIKQCEHPTALIHETKDIILEVEKLLLPLKPHAGSLLIETKGGGVVANMSLEDFFNLLDLAKRIEINDRFRKATPLAREVSNSIDKEIMEFLDTLDNE